jgi:hypothetical protein
VPENQLMEFIGARFTSLESQITALRTSFESADARTNARIDKLNTLAITGMGAAMLALLGWVMTAIQKG